MPVLPPACREKGSAEAGPFSCIDSDIASPFIDTSELEVKEVRPGWMGRFFHSANMTFGYWDVAAGSWIHEHAHENEEVWHVIEGEFEFTVGGETSRAGPGSVAVVPAATPHSVEALTDGRAIVVDHPVRPEIGGVSTE